MIGTRARAWYFYAPVPLGSVCAQQLIETDPRVLPCFDSVSPLQAVRANGVAVGRFLIRAKAVSAFVLTLCTDTAGTRFAHHILAPATWKETFDEGSMAVK